MSWGSSNHWQPPPGHHSANCSRTCSRVIGGVGVGQEDAEDGLERRHVAVDVVLGAPAVLADALERIAAVGRLANLEPHAAGGFVEDGRALLNLLAYLGAARVAHPGAHDIVKGQVVLVEPGWIGMVITGIVGAVARAAGVRRAPRSIDHSGIPLVGIGALARRGLGEHLIRNMYVRIDARHIVKVFEAFDETHHRRRLVNR